MMSSEEVVEVQSTRPKKPFLRSGEGTKRRVFASKHIEEAKLRREENLQKAQQREYCRNESPDWQAQTNSTGNNSKDLKKKLMSPTVESVFTSDNRFVSLENTKSSTFSSESKVVNDGHCSSELEIPVHSESTPHRFVFGEHSTTSQTAWHEEEGPADVISSNNRHFFGEKQEQRAENEQDMIGKDCGVDGSCRINSEFATVAAATDEARESLKSDWLESQRVCEERQWAEALELQEFEALEKQIVQDTRQKLEDAQDAIKRKQVTFYNPAEEPQTGSRRTNSSASISADEKNMKHTKIASEAKGLRQKQKEVQKLKDISVTRSSKKAKGVTQNGVKNLTQKCTKSSFKHDGKNEEEQDFAVDSKFLDQLIEKDCKFADPSLEQPQCRNNLEPQTLLAEKLKLTTLKEEFDNEKLEWQQKQASALSHFEAVKSEELKKIKRERRVLEQQSKALLKLPNKKERSEIEALEAIIDQERKESKSREARHKLTVERLRDQIDRLQVMNKDLQDEVKWHEEMHLMKEDKAELKCQSSETDPIITIEATMQTESVNENSPLTDRCNYDDNREKWRLRLENPFYFDPPIGEQPQRQEPYCPYLESPPRQCMQQRTEAENLSLPFQTQQTVVGNTSTRLPQLSGTQLTHPQQLSNGIGHIPGLCFPLSDPLTLNTYPGPMSSPHWNAPANVTPAFRTDFFQRQYPLPSFPQSLFPWSSNLQPPPSFLMNSAAPNVTSTTYNACPFVQNELPGDFLHQPSQYSEPLNHFDFSVSGQTDRVPSKTNTLSDFKERGNEFRLPSKPRSIDADKYSIPDQEHVEESRFDNGTVKQTYSDGRVVVWFLNSDVKHVHSCGRVEYFYADLNTWQVTHKNKIDVFYFDIGQIEAHKENGDKDIIFPDGSTRTVLKNGMEIDIPERDLVNEIYLPKPEIPQNKPDLKKHRKPNKVSHAKPKQKQ